MNMTAVAPMPSPIEQTLLKAVGLDKATPEQRQLALHIAERYGLDLMLKHLVLVEGRPYITRDGLLHVAHRSGVFDGIEVTDPVLGETHWTARATVYRKDMTRGFTYSGRYPKSGGNARFAPEMAVKVAEVMSLRRAFDVSAPVVEERWDLDEAAPVTPREPVSLAAKAAAGRARIEARTDDQEPATWPGSDAEPSDPAATSGPVTRPETPAADAVTGEVVALARCEAKSPYEGNEQCRREAGHTGMHKSSSRESWEQ